MGMIPVEQTTAIIEASKPKPLTEVITGIIIIVIASLILMLIGKYMEKKK